jgi:hypothetical protein
VGAVGAAGAVAVGAMGAATVGAVGAVGAVAVGTVLRRSCSCIFMAGMSVKRVFWYNITSAVLREYMPGTVVSAGLCYHKYVLQ